MHVNKLRFGMLVVLLFLYVAGVLILSAVVTLHEQPIRNLANLKRERYEQLSRLRNIDYDRRGDGLYHHHHHQQQIASSVLRPKPPQPPPPPPPLPLRGRSKIQWCTILKYLNPPQHHLVALVSFPGSGNTWLRYLLQQATGFYTGSVYKDYGLLKNGFPAENISNGSVLVVKTHEWGTNARRQFNKAILLVRAPGPSIQAEFNRQSGGHIGFASPDRYKRTKGKYWQQFVDNKLESWKQTNMDWLHNFTGPTHVIFYEQLIDNLETTLKSIIDFLNLNLNQQLFNCAVQRKEGIYRRKRRVLNFDPYTEKMKQKLLKYQQQVYDAIYNFASPSPPPPPPPPQK